MDTETALVIAAEGYEEVPADVETFLKNDRYMGEATKGGERIYPVVMEDLKKIFPNPVAPSPYFKVFLRGCFTGDTKISLLDGTEKSFEELKRNCKNGKFWVYSCKSDGVVVPGLAHSPRITGTVDKLVEITLDSGKSERCTLDHPWMTKDGQYKEAQDLKPGDSLMPLYRELDRDGYEKIIMPNGSKRRTSRSLGPMNKYSDAYNEKLREIRKVDPNYLLTNHKVINVRIINLKDPIPVYDITVDEHHNFALSSGVFVHNSIGWGKTTLAELAQVYNLYRLTLMSDPHDFYGLFKTRNISFLCFSATLDLAGETFDEFTELLGTSPYFRRVARVDKEGRIVYFPKRIIVKPASTITHTLGQAVMGGILDEANFHRSGSEGTYKAYASVVRRMGSRFEKDGYVAGQIFAISSETDISSFMERMDNEWRGKSGVLILSHAVYETGKRVYKEKEKFNVFVGDGIRPPRVVEEREITPEIESYIERVPDVYKSDYDTDIFNALRDISGMPMSERRKFYPSKASILTVAKLPNIFHEEVIVLPFSGNERLIDHCNKDYLGKLDMKRPRNFHVDIATAERGDRLGLGGAYFRSYKDTVRRHIETGEFFHTREPFIVLEMCVGIQAAPGEEIPLFKIFEFFLDLRDFGYNIFEITADGYQSADMLQRVKRRGWESRVISTDREDDVPVIFKHTVLDRRCIIPKNNILVKELLSLERVGKKIDHPDGESKDLADGAAGAAYGALDNVKKAPMAISTIPESAQAVPGRKRTIYDRLTDLGGKSYPGRF